VLRQRLGLPDAQLPPVVAGLGHGARIERAHLAREGQSILMPVDQCLGLADLGGISDALRALWLCLDRAVREPPKRLAQQRRPLLREAPGEALRRILRGDALLAHGDDRARIQTFLHAHDANARRRIAGENRPLDRSGAAPARQQRGVDVHAAERRHRQDFARQDQPVGHDDEHVDAESGDQGYRLGRVQRRRLVHR
jgi:hypothetical protein